mgnify:CR=1 FL=1
MVKHELVVQVYLDCARKVDFYCIGCHHAIWDLENEESLAYLVGRGRAFWCLGRVNTRMVLRRGLLADLAHSMAGVDSLLYTKTDFQVWSLASTCICPVH